MKRFFCKSNIIAVGLLSVVGCTQLESTSTTTEVSTNQDSTYSSKPSIEKFKAYTQRFTEDTLMTKSHATGHVGDLFFTHWKDGGAASLDMQTDGSFSVNWQGGGYNYVGGPGWHNGDKNRVIGYRFDQDSGANFITVYGWGYDKNMSPDNPEHLVEYYILQRWSDAYNPSDNGLFGKTFVSNGVEYSTYRTIRKQKPSINNISTFYQYWSKPTQQQPLGQTLEIVIADHMNAWAESGWSLPNTNNFDASDDPTYQVMAVEVFDPPADGVASGQVWDATPR